jgi:hypothetical protein
MLSQRRRPRGHIEALPSGRYRAVVYAGVDPLTRRPRYLKESAPNFDAAEVVLTRLQHQVDQDAHPRRTSPSVAPSRSGSRSPGWKTRRVIGTRTSSGCTSHRPLVSCPPPSSTRRCSNGPMRVCSAADTCVPGGPSRGTFVDRLRQRPCGRSTSSSMAPSSALFAGDIWA